MSCVIIALFKAESSNDGIDSYIEKIESEGQNAVILPTLAFNFINSDVLYQHLQKIEDFEGIIFTSPRAVEAVHKVVSVMPDIFLLKLKGKTNYSVGESTSKVARDLMQIDCLGEKSGNAEQLSCLILSSYPDRSCKPFLFPSSNMKKDILPTVFKENGIDLVEIVSYETICNPALKSNWEKIVSNSGLPSILVFFSPSGVMFTHDLVKKSYLSTCMPKCIAIGPSTAKALSDVNIPPCQIASKPNPDAVYDAIKQII